MAAKSTRPNTPLPAPAPRPAEPPPGIDVNRFEVSPPDDAGRVKARCEFGGVREVLMLGPAKSRQVWRRVEGAWTELAESEVQSLVNRLTDAARNAAWDYTASDAGEKYSRMLDLFAATYGKSRTELDEGFTGLKK